MEADIEFPELRECAEPGEFRFVGVSEISAVDGESSYRQVFGEADEVWCEFFSAPSHYRLAYANGLTFQVMAGGREIRYASTDAEIPDSTIRHLFLHQILPLAGSVQGRLILHAGGVVVAGRAVAFAGESGAGKSTLSYAFAQRGYAFLTDDMFAVERTTDGYDALPGLPYVRLYEATLDELGADKAGRQDELDWLDKLRVQAGAGWRHYEGRAPLGAIYFLGTEEAAEIAVRALEPADAFVELSQVTFRLEMKKRDALGEQFAQMAAMAEGVAAFSLSYPRDHARIGEVIDFVLEHQRSLMPVTPTYSVPVAVSARQQGEQRLLMNLETGTYHELNGTASLIWDRLAKGEGVDSIQAWLCREFEVAPAVADADLQGLLRELASRGLVEAEG